MGWKATLSNGQIVEENVGSWVEIPGERLPWARLCQFCENNNLVIDKVEYNGIHLPSPLQRFQLQGLAPNNYSISHIIELDNIFGGHSTSEFVDVCSHYDNFAIHHISNGEESWLLVTELNDAPALSPNRKERK